MSDWINSMSFLVLLGHPHQKILSLLERYDTQQNASCFICFQNAHPTFLRNGMQANEYIKTLGIKKGKPFETLFPAADPAALDLLKKMLKFNPKQRCTVAEALEHEFLRAVRGKEMERRADEPLVGPDFLESNHVDLNMLKRRTFEEVLWYRDQVTGAPT
jgi:serine/threonine protein kinase